MSDVASRDQNNVPTLLGVSSVDGVTPVPVYVDPVTHRLLVQISGGGGGGIETIAIASANGLAGTSDGDPTNVTLTLSTTVNAPVLAGNGTAIAAATTTGSGSTVVLATSPTLVTPLLGTPTSGVLTNCTGYTVGNISGLGTGVGAALAINIGSAGAVVLFNGALGTPSSGTLTNCTGLPISTGVSGLGANVATFLATPSSANLAAAVTDETGTGSLVFGTSPTLTTPAIVAGTRTFTVEPGADDTAYGDILAGILAGDTIAQWDLVYLDTASGRWELADADAVTTAGSVLVGLALAAGTDGNALSVLIKGIVRNDGWTWTVGNVLYASGTLGALTATVPSGTDDVIRVMGYATSDDSIWFDPAKSWITHT